MTLYVINGTNRRTGKRKVMNDVTEPKHHYMLMFESKGAAERYLEKYLKTPEVKRKWKNIRISQ